MSLAGDAPGAGRGRLPAPDAIDATRFHHTMSWVVSFLILRRAQEGGARGRRAPLVVHDGALRARPSFYDFPPPFSLSPADVRDRTNLERRLIDDDDGAVPASHYLPSLLIATSAGATTVAPPGRAARERGRPALCANVLGMVLTRPRSRSFVLFFPARPHVGAGRPAGSTPLRVRTVFFEAVMFPLHCYPHIVPLTTPRVVSSLPPALIRSSQSK